MERVEARLHSQHNFVGTVQAELLAS